MPARTDLRDLFAAADRPWFRLSQAASGSSAELFVYGTIGSFWAGLTARDLVEQLRELDVDEIQLRVNSPGGLVYDAIAIMNALHRHKARVVATVDGLAASAASFMIMAADEIVMGLGSELMIHDPWTIMLGNAGELRKEADLLDKTASSIARIYQRRAGGTAQEWRAAMVEETWYSAEEAVAAGLADRVDGDTAAGDGDDPDGIESAMRELFRHASRSAAPAPYIPAARLNGQRRGEGRVSLAPEILAAAALLEPATTPADPPRVDKPKEVSDVSDALNRGLRERLGLGADVELDDAGLLARLDERLAAPQPAPVPPGVVLVESAQLEQLRADAEAGRQAREAQLRAEREATVDAAVRDGRIPPARKAHWVSLLEADPGAADVLASLAKGTVPVQANGYTGGVDESAEETAVYSKFWGTDEKKGA